MRPMSTVKVAYMYGQRGLCVWQKRPVEISNAELRGVSEAVLARLIGPSVCGKRDLETSKETYSRGKRGLLYAVQDTLPQLPLPRLRDTCERFLISIRPFLRPGARPLQSSRVRGCRPNCHRIDSRFSCVWQRNMTTLPSTFRTWRRVVEQERHCRSPAMRGQ